VKQTKKKKKKKTGYTDQTIEVEGKTIKCVDATHEQFCKIMGFKVAPTVAQMEALSASRGDHDRNGKDGFRLAVTPKQDAKGNKLTGTRKERLYENMTRYAAGSTNGKIVILFIL